MFFENGWLMRSGRPAGKFMKPMACPAGKFMKPIAYWSAGFAGKDPCGHPAKRPLLGVATYLYIT